jgi:AcrR family transcriptional regulator
MLTKNPPLSAQIAGHKKGRVPRALREQQILDISEALFLSKGYDATSIEEICRAADVSRPVVYDLIGNKAAIYLACVRRVRGVFEETLSEAAGSTEEPLQKLQLGIDTWFRLLEDDPRILELLYGKAGIGELATELARERAGTVETIVANLRDAAPDVDSERINAYANLMSGAAEQLSRWWLANPDIPRQTIVGYIVEFVWNGVQQLVNEPDAR